MWSPVSFLTFCFFFQQFIRVVLFDFFFIVPWKIFGIFHFFSNGVHILFFKLTDDEVLFFQLQLIILNGY